MQKNLYILRHAEAEPGSAATEDRERALTAKGMADAQALGDAFRRAGIMPDLVLCSTAKRTRQTLAAVLPQLAPERCRTVDAMYSASAKGLHELLAEAPETVGSLLLVGHNPAVHELAVALAATGDPRALDDVSLRYPPCTLTHIRFTGAWGEAGVLVPDSL